MIDDIPIEIEVINTGDLLLYEVTVWPRVLTEEEILALYLQGYLYRFPQDPTNEHSSRFLLSLAIAAVLIEVLIHSIK